MARTTSTNSFIINYVPWTIEEETGYKPISTYWQDFSIAEAFGGHALLDTLERCIKHASSKGKDCYKYMTELTLVLNHKIWQHYDEKNEKNSREDLLSRCYDVMWKQVDGWCCENLTGEEASYYFRVTD